MIPQPRQTTHRPKRELQEIRAAELAHLRSENQRLKRQNARLRRELEKYGSQIEESITESEEPTLAENEKVSKKSNGCPQCDGELSSMVFGPKQYLVCKACKWRQPQNVTGD